MNNKTPKQIFDFLPGTWDISRTMIAHTTDSFHKAVGYGTFLISDHDPNIILYSEQLKMLNSATIGTQKYSYHYDVFTDILSKYFDNDAFFYQLNILDDRIYGSHLCIKDQYVSNYTLNKDNMTITYYVCGPSKNHTIITEYTNNSAI